MSGAARSPFFSLRSRRLRVPIPDVQPLSRDDRQRPIGKPIVPPLPQIFPALSRKETEGPILPRIDDPVFQAILSHPKADVKTGRTAIAISTPRLSFLCQETAAMKQPVTLATEPTPRVHPVHLKGGTRQSATARARRPIRRYGLRRQALRERLRSISFLEKTSLISSYPSHQSG